MKFHIKLVYQDLIGTFHRTEEREFLNRAAADNWCEFHSCNDEATFIDYEVISQVDQS